MDRDYDDDRVERRNYGGRNYGRGAYRGGRRYNNYDKGGYRYRDKRDYNRDYDDRDDDRYDKRRKYDEDDTEKRLKSLIVRIGDKSNSSLEDNLETLTNALDADLSRHKSTIIETLFTCVLCLPVKTSVYATLVGLLNLRNFELGKEVISKVHSLLQEAFEKSNFSHIKYLVRFVAELVNANVLLHASIIELFYQFASLIDENDAERSDYFVHLILMTLPWAGKELSDKKPEELGKVLTNVETWIKKRSSQANPILFPFQVDSKEDEITMLWNNIVEMRDSHNWTVSAILKPYSYFEKLTASLQHNLPPIKILLSGAKFPALRCKFRIYDSEDSEEDMRPVDRYIIENFVVDIIENFASSHKEAVHQLLSIPVNFDIDYVMLETIFGEMLKLPNPVFKEIFYGVLLADLLKTKPSIAPVFGLAIATVFERSDELDVECVDRFTSWFSHHLSNFEYKWDWPAWNYVFEEKDEAKLYFIKDTLAKCMKLSYYDRIKKTITEEYFAVFPELPAPHFKYDQPENNIDRDYNGKVNELLERFKTKAKVEEITEFVASDAFGEFTHDDKLEIILYAILKAGSKTFSHFLATLERYLPLLNSFVTTAEHRLHVIKTLAEFWKHSPQNLSIQLDRFMTYRVVDNISIVNWIFSPEEQPNLVKGYMWGILYNTINKTLARTETIREELVDAERDLERVAAEEQVEDHPEVRRTKLRRETYDQALRETKEVFLIIFQHFCLSIGEHLTQSEANGNDPSNFWFHMTLGHLKATGRKYCKEIKPFMTTLESLLFTNVDQRLVSIFQQMKAIH